MPKVIHVLRKFEPEEWGGIETHLVGLIPELARLGWESEVHAPAEHGTDGRAVEALGARFVTFRARYPYLGLDAAKRAGLVAAGGNLVSVDELLTLLVDDRASVFHVHTLGRLGGVVRTASRVRGVPYAVTLHGPVRADADVVARDATRRTRGLVDLGAPFGWAVGARRVVHDADLLFALNRHELDAWRDDRRGKHLERVAHGVDARGATAEARAEARRLVGDGRFVVVVARLDRGKGQDLALDAFAAAAPADVRIVLAGAAVDEEYAASLRARAESMGGRARVLGGVTPAIARALIAEAELALVPSRAEPFGIVLLECWAEQTPALFSDVGGLGDIARATGVTRGLVPPNDVDAWARALRDALADGAWLASERASARARVEKGYTWRSLAERTARAYESVRAHRRVA